MKIKNPLRAQSKYGLMGSSAKTEKNFIRELQQQKRLHFWVQNIKVPVGIGHHPQLHIKPSLYVCRRVPEDDVSMPKTFVHGHSHMKTFLHLKVHNG